MKAAIDEFKEIQEYMFLAREEKAEKTYTKLKKKYLSLKAILQVAGVNMTDIDEFKEWLLLAIEESIVSAIWSVVSMEEIPRLTVLDERNDGG